MSDDGGLEPRPHPARGPLPVDGSQWRYVLTINGGSSSLTFAVFATADPVERVLSGCVERVGLERSRLVVRDGGGGRSEEPAVTAPDQAAAARLAIEPVATNSGLASIAAVWHPVVH